MSAEITTIKMNIKEVNNNEINIVKTKKLRGMEKWVVRVFERPTGEYLFNRILNTLTIDMFNKGYKVRMDLENLDQQRQ